MILARSLKVNTHSALIMSLGCLEEDFSRYFRRSLILFDSSSSKSTTLIIKSLSVLSKADNLAQDSLHSLSILARHLDQLVHHVDGEPGPQLPVCGG